MYVSLPNEIDGMTSKPEIKENEQKFYPKYLWIK